MVSWYIPIPCRSRPANFRIINPTPHIQTPYFYVKVGCKYVIRPVYYYVSAILLSGSEGRDDIDPVIRAHKGVIRIFLSQYLREQVGLSLQFDGQREASKIIIF